MIHWRHHHNTVTGFHEIRDESDNVVAVAGAEESARIMAAAPEMLDALQRVFGGAPLEYGPTSPWAHIEALLAQQGITHLPGSAAASVAATRLSPSWCK